MSSRILQVFVVTILFVSFSNGNDQDNNSVFFYNNRKKCSADNYFDVDIFKCRLCDPNFNLKSSKEKDRCICDNNSTEVFEYDNIRKRPICEKPFHLSGQTLCPQRYVNATKFSSVRKSVKIYRKFQNESCDCNEKRNELYEDFCIENELFKDINLPYKNLPLTQSLNLNRDLKFIVFLCQVLHQRKFCNFLANICVLTNYDLNENGPCHPFYNQQKNPNELSSMNDDTSDGSERLKPFLFFSSGKSGRSLFKQPIDFSYDVHDSSVNSTINFTLVSYNLRGDVVKMRQMKLNDLNLCNLYSSPLNLWEQNIKFARNLISKCTINLQEIVNLKQETIFNTIFLNYYENQANFLQTVPIAIRDAFDVNKLDDIERWQLVKRFFLVDTVSGRQFSTNGKTKDDDDDSQMKFHEKFNQIRYVRSVELRFYYDDDESHAGNKINIPVLILDYGVLNLTSTTSAESEAYNIDFSFKVTFIKRSNLANLFQIILPILSTIAVLYAFLQNFFFKIRQQKRDFDCATLINLILNLLGNLSNALFLFVLIFVNYVFVLYKSQSSLIKISLPLKSEENVVEILLLIAFLFKIVKISSMFNDIIDVDIFFIDFERPKYSSDNFAHGLNKSIPGTPSISSSLKPTLSPNNDCAAVSCWRNYFIANEWQELMTKRKISIHLHVVYVIGAILVLGFENYASLEFNLHLNQTHKQSYLDLLKTSDAADETDNRILLVAVGSMVYLVVYLMQRLYNFLIYERFIDNCLQQFSDVASIANISVLILLDSFGYYIHGRSVHGRSDIDTFNMILQFKREEENLVGRRGLLPGGDHQTYTILAPKNLRIFYEKLINPITTKTSRNQSQFSNQSMKFNYGFEKLILTYHNINRFFAAFIDHALKDVDYVVKEKNLFEKLFDCEIYTSTSDSKGVFYFDNGHSFDKVLFYGNENSIFGFEYLLFVFLLFITGNILIASLSIGITFKIIEQIINHLTKNNLARKTLIDKRFLI